MENRKSLYSTGTRGNKSRWPCSRRRDTERSVSLPVKDRFVKTNLQRSSSTQVLEKKKNSLYCEDFRFTGFDKSLLENPRFKEFLSKVYCPFCLKAQSDKTNLIKHFDEKCSKKMKKRSKLYAIFQIYPSNAIKCNVCFDVVLTSIEYYFFHLNSNDHMLKCFELEQAGKEFTDLLYCACCKIFVLNSYIQLQAHVKNETHEIRRKSSLKSDYFLRRGSNSIYCFYNTKKKFKCLLCFSNFLFNTPWEFFNHSRSLSHKKHAKTNNLLSEVYCCFCDEEVYAYEIQDHFTSDDHMENENSVTAEGSYELCLYCGVTRSSPLDLSIHMEVECNEVNKVRQEKGWKVGEELNENKMIKKDQTNQKLQKKKCILIKDNINTSKLLKILKNFGEVTCMKKYDDEYLIIEFRNETAVESILLVQSFVKVHKGVDIKFLNEAPKDETDILFVD